ncbi:MAG TPA: histidine--tRNA ligase [Candidatus Atribacteria bacterium]|nr:histidine--tRNA ligase [Candidatus Atribacteria bacterium]
MLTKAPKGTKDVLPQESYKWHYIEDTIRDITRSFGYSEIRTPVFEHTELFVRSVGDTTDIVKKEMFTFEDKGHRSLTLRPEGTAGVVRAYIEHNLYTDLQPAKLYYIAPCFRHERPQAGRLREFHQFGIEAFGGKEASLDAEIIALAVTLFDRLGIKGLKTGINSIGCPECRPKYHETLREFLKSNLDGLCAVCKERFEKNPLRILDCKEEKCKEVVRNVPHMLDHLCDGCRVHFDELKGYLDAAGIKYEVDPMIVRGLDYYTKTVFEIVSDSLGAQSTVCGGGRYDRLVEECGGPSVPGVGFGLGLERLLLIMEAQGIEAGKPCAYDAYIAALGDQARHKAFEIVQKLRSMGICADMDHAGRSLKAQFRYADKQGARYVCTLGDNELTAGELQVKNMATGTAANVPIDMIGTYLKEQLGGIENE